MSRVTTTVRVDPEVELRAQRTEGNLGNGLNSNRVYAIIFNDLPIEAQDKLNRIAAGFGIDHPRDGIPFGNRFQDLPTGNYREFTVPTPGATNRGMRRIVLREGTGQAFFTACHYERFESRGGTAAENRAASLAATQQEDPEYRNGFYIITGLPAALRQQLAGRYP